MTISFAYASHVSSGGEAVAQSRVVEGSAVILVGLFVWPRTGSLETRRTGSNRRLQPTLCASWGRRLVAAERLGWRGQRGQRGHAGSADLRVRPARSRWIT